MEVNVPETRKQRRKMFVKIVFDIFLIIEKKGMLYIFMTKGPYTHQTKAKAKEQRFDCCSSSQIHSEVFNTEQTLSSLQVQDGP